MNSSVLVAPFRKVGPLAIGKRSRELCVRRTKSKHFCIVPFRPIAQVFRDVSQGCRTFPSIFRPKFAQKQGIRKIKKARQPSDLEFWSRGLDSNQRPSGYERTGTYNQAVQQVHLNQQQRSDLHLLIHNNQFCLVNQ